jgi:hypothetical protein
LIWIAKIAKQYEIKKNRKNRKRTGNGGDDTEKVIRIISDPVSYVEQTALISRHSLKKGHAFHPHYSGAKP